VASRQNINTNEYLIIPMEDEVLPYTTVRAGGKFITYTLKWFTFILRYKRRIPCHNIANV